MVCSRTLAGIQVEVDHESGLGRSPVKELEPNVLELPDEDLYVELQASGRGVYGASKER